MNVRDAMLVQNTPIDYLDFASPVSGLGSKMGPDATNLWPGRDAARVGHHHCYAAGGDGADGWGVADAGLVSQILCAK